MHLPSLEEGGIAEDKARRRHSYTGANEFAFHPPFLPSTPPAPPPQSNHPANQQQQQQQQAKVTRESNDFDEKKARYKLQLRHFRHRRRYSDWFFTLYEFDKPENPEVRDGVKNSG